MLDLILNFTKKDFSFVTNMTYNNNLGGLREREERERERQT